MRRNTIAFASVLMLVGSGAALAQARDPGLATPTGSELSAGVASYTYREPGDQAISIHGVKLVAVYTGTTALGGSHRWFAQAEGHGTIGNTAYDGWCSPFLITPNSGSPNGYELDIGDPSPCAERGDADWYVEGRALVGRDLRNDSWGWSPFAGLGVRHLSNGTTGVAGYRTDDYLYVPAGVTARTSVARSRTIALTVEADVLLHGWQHTRDSALGGGDVPATSTAPPFTIDSFSDISFSQPGGWALRAGAAYPVTRRWTLEPYYVRWSVRASPVNEETATFTVNGVAAHEQLGAYEPVNVTNELGVRLGVHF